MGLFIGDSECMWISERRHEVNVLSWRRNKCNETSTAQHSAANLMMWRYVT